MSDFYESIPNKKNDIIIDKNKIQDFVNDRSQFESIQQKKPINNKNQNLHDQRRYNLKESNINESDFIDIDNDYQLNNVRERLELLKKHGLQPNLAYNQHIRRDQAYLNMIKRQNHSTDQFATMDYFYKDEDEIQATPLSEKDKMGPLFDRINKLKAIAMKQQVEIVQTQGKTKMSQVIDPQIREKQLKNYNIAKNQKESEFIFVDADEKQDYGDPDDYKNHEFKKKEGQGGNKYDQFGKRDDLVQHFNKLQKTQEFYRMYSSSSRDTSVQQGFKCEIYNQFDIFQTKNLKVFHKKYLRNIDLSNKYNLKLKDLILQEENPEGQKLKEQSLANQKEYEELEKKKQSQKSLLNSKVSKTTANQSINQSLKITTDTAKGPNTEVITPNQPVGTKKPAIKAPSLGEKKITQLVNKPIEIQEKINMVKNDTDTPMGDYGFNKRSQENTLKNKNSNISPLKRPGGSRK